MSLSGVDDVEQARDADELSAPLFATRPLRLPGVVKCALACGGGAPTRAFSSTCGREANRCWSVALAAARCMLALVAFGTGLSAPFRVETGTFAFARFFVLGLCNLAAVSLQVKSWRRLRARNVFDAIDSARGSGARGRGSSLRDPLVPRGANPVDADAVSAPQQHFVAARPAALVGAYGSRAHVLPAFRPASGSNAGLDGVATGRASRVQSDSDTVAAAPDERIDAADAGLLWADASGTAWLGLVAGSLWLLLLVGSLLVHVRLAPASTRQVLFAGDLPVWAGSALSAATFALLLPTVVGAAAHIVATVHSAFLQLHRAHERGVFVPPSDPDELRRSHLSAFLSVTRASDDLSGSVVAALVALLSSYAFELLWLYGAAFNRSLLLVGEGLSLQLRAIAFGCPTAVAILLIVVVTKFMGRLASVHEAGRGLLEVAAAHGAYPLAERAGLIAAMQHLPIAFTLSGLAVTPNVVRVVALSFSVLLLPVLVEEAL